METFKIIYTLIGGLGIFFYGMKSMSDGMQAMAGDMIRNIINSLTRNRFTALAVGVVVTMLIQSSSVTTVMVVGLVNAGLMKLTQALGIIFGANIGTTITGWIISIKVGKYGLLLIGLGIFPMLFSKKEIWRQVGQIFFAIGLVFFGLEIMSDAFKPLRNSDSFRQIVAYYSEPTYLSYFLSIITGCFITMIVQSSSAMLGITMSLGTTGIISFPTAAALVLGENIGTTITALLASVGGNINAKRAALGHAIFNVAGVSLVFLIFPYYVKFVEWFVPGGPADLIGPDGTKPNIAYHIASAHSIFNISASLFFLPFLNYLAKFVTKITPEKRKSKKEKDYFLLMEASSTLPAAAIIQAQEEIKKMRTIVKKMFNFTIEYLEAQSPRPDLLSKISKYESITDNIQREITLFICHTMEKPLTTNQSNMCQSLVRIADELESIADYLEKAVKYKGRFTNGNPITAGESREEFFNFVKNVQKYFNDSSYPIESGEKADPSRFERKAGQISIWADNIKDNHLKRVSNGEFNALTALVFSDMVVAFRKIRNHSLNIAQSLK